MQHNIVSIIPDVLCENLILLLWYDDHLVPVVQQKIRSCRNVSSSSRSIHCLQVLLLSNNSMHVEHSTFISDPLSFTSVLQNRRHSVFITNTDSCDHRAQCVILGHSSRDALYWKMKMSRNSKHKTTCSTCLQIPQRLKQSVVLLRGTHPPSPWNGRPCV